MRLSLPKGSSFCRAGTVRAIHVRAIYLYQSRRLTDLGIKLVPHLVPKAVMQPCQPPIVGVRRECERVDGGLQVHSAERMSYEEK